MKKIFLCITCIVSVVTFSFSQAVIKWQKTIGGGGHDVLHAADATSDGGFILAGNSYSWISGDKTEECIGVVDYWIVKLDSLGNIEWENTIGGTDVDDPYTVQQTADGGYIIGGQSLSDISGDKTQDHIGSKDYWLLKLDNSGNIEWQQTIGGSANDGLVSIRQSADGGYILGGESYSGISGNKTVNGFGESDYWIIKLDASGNIQWQKSFGGAGYDRTGAVEFTIDGGYIAYGSSNSGLGSIKTEGSMGGSDIWILKLNAEGNITWQNTIGGDLDDGCNSIKQTMDGGYILSASSHSGISGDKTEANVSVESDYWIMKLDASGNILWQNNIGGNKDDDLARVIQTSDGNYMVGGYSESDNSFDKTENSKGYYDYWIVKLDSSGNMLWDNTIGGNDNDYFSGIDLTSDGDYFISGRSYSSISGDKAGDSKGGLDYWVMVLTENFNLATGKMFYDFNSNSIQDSGEPPLANHIVSETTTGRFSFSESDGSYAVSVLDMGSFIVIPDTVNYYNPEPSTHPVTFSGTNEVDSLNDFAFQPAGVFNDLAVVLTPLNDFNPGFDALYSIDYTNVGTTTLAGTIVFYFPPDLSYVTASTLPDLVTPDSIVWYTGTLSPFQTGSILLTLNVNASTVIGSAISSTTVITPVSSDSDSSNNYSTWEVIVTGSFDPNEKLVNIHNIAATALLSPPYLEYIINFQNTGTDTALNVKITDKIPPALDMSSFELVASSDPASIVFDQSNNKLVFQFLNIQLPDSNVNEAASHGFVRFKVKPLTTLSAGDIIVNNANIFFDFNDAIKTNDAVTYIDVATFVDETESAVSDMQLFPNPASQMVTISMAQPASDPINLFIYDVFGREIYRLQTAHQKQIVLDVSKFAAGIYVICLQTNGKCFAEKMIKN